MSLIILIRITMKKTKKEYNLHIKNYKFLLGIIFYLFNSSCSVNKTFELGI